METAFHKQINYANAYGNEGGYGLIWSWESVCGAGGADDDARVISSAFNRRELAPGTLSCNIYYVRTRLCLHTVPASCL